MHNIIFIIWKNAIVYIHHLQNRCSWNFAKQNICLAFAVFECRILFFSILRKYLHLHAPSSEPSRGVNIFYFSLLDKFQHLPLPPFFLMDGHFAKQLFPRLPRKVAPVTLIVQYVTAPTSFCRKIFTPVAPIKLKLCRENFSVPKARYALNQLCQVINALGIF